MVSPEHENATIEVGTAGPATSQREQVLECPLKGASISGGTVVKNKLSGGRSSSDAQQAARPSYRKGRDTPS